MRIIYRKKSEAAETGRDPRISSGFNHRRSDFRRFDLPSSELGKKVSLARMSSSYCSTLENYSKYNEIENNNRRVVTDTPS